MVARSRWISLATLALALPLAACTRKDAANGTDTTAVAAAPAAADAPSASPSAGSGFDDRAIGAYPLSMDRLTRATQAGRNIRAAEKADPGLRERWHHKGEDVDSEDLNANLSALLSRIEGTPAIKGAVESAGLSPRDFVMTTFALVSANAAAQMKKMGTPPEDSGLGAHVSDANVAFVSAHQADVAALMELSK